MGRKHMKRIGICLCIIIFVSLACGGMGSLAGFSTPTGQPSFIPAASLTPTEYTYPTPTWTPTATLTPTLEPAPTATLPPFGGLARGYLEGLSNGIGRRVDDTESATRAVDYIRNQFSTMGYSPEVQPFTYQNDDGTTAHSANVIAVKKGLSDKQVIVGAHYDSVDVGRGADDNASGVAILLEAAQRVRTVDTPYTIIFITFGAEEVDILGSQYYVSQMRKDEIANTVYMVNLDSLISGNKTYAYGTVGKKGKVRDWALKDAKSLGLDLLDEPNFNPDDPNDSSDDDSDHGSFRAVGIQFIYFESTDWTLGDGDGWTQVNTQYGEDGEIWHTKYDQIAYLDITFPGRIDAHLNLYSTILYDILTRYQE